MRRGAGDLEPYPSVSAAIAALLAVAIAWAGVAAAIPMALFERWTVFAVLGYALTPIPLALAGLYIGWRSRSASAALWVGAFVGGPYVLAGLLSLAQSFQGLRGVELSLLVLGAGAVQFAAAYVPGRVMASRWRRRLDPAHNLCPQCGYSLAGLPERACPECGWGRSE